MIMNIVSNVNSIDTILHTSVYVQYITIFHIRTKKEEKVLY